MKTHFLFFIGVCNVLCFCTQAQTIVLHSSVGDTIDLHEKIKYDLFLDIPNTNFKHATISQIDDAVVLKFKEGTTIKKKTISNSDIEMYKERISLLNAYFEKKEDELVGFTKSAIVYDNNYYLEYERIVDEKKLDVIRRQGKIDKSTKAFTQPDHIKYQSEDYTGNRFSNSHLNRDAQ